MAQRAGSIVLDSLDMPLPNPGRFKNNPNHLIKDTGLGVESPLPGEDRSSQKEHNVLRGSGR